MMRIGWIDSARAIPVAEVADALGLDVAADGRSFGPCPSCGALRRANPGRRDRRGRCRVYPGGKGWACCSNGTDGCGARGDGLTLVAWQLTGNVWSRGDRATGDRVRAWFASHGWTPHAGAFGTRKIQRPTRFTPDAAEDLPRLPAADVADVWRMGAPVSIDPKVAAWLAGRGLDPKRLAALDLARALPRTVRLPAWARSRGQPWTDSGHRLIVPAFEPDDTTAGALRLASLHARCVRPCAPGEKGAWPAGASCRGLILATSADAPTRAGEARQLVTVVEGVPDFLSLALWPTEARGALLGGWSGSATAATAELIPRGWTVALGHHDDNGGDKQANAWARVLAGRGCDLKRIRVVATVDAA